MKKPLLILILLIAVALASFLWLRSQMGITDPARLLPKDILAMIALPDLPRTFLRWPATALARMSKEKEVAAFLEKPMGFFGKEKGGEEAGRILTALKPGRIFTALLPGEGRLRVLVGFQYWGSQKDFDAAIERLRAEVSETPLPAPSIEREAGLEWRSAETKQGKLFWGASSRWGFVSNDRAAVIDALQRASGRKTGVASLEEDADFRACRAAIVANPDLLAFVRPSPVLDAVLAAAAEMNMEPIPEHVEGIRKAAAVGYGLRADGANLKESLFVLRPNPPDLGPLSHLGMAFTENSTLGYWDMLLRMESVARLLSSGLLASNLQATEAELAERLPQALSGQFSLVINWPAESARPAAFAFLGVKDRAAARELLLQVATARFPEVQISEEDTAEFFAFPKLGVPFASPALALNDRMLVLGLDGSELRNILASPPTTNLEASPAFLPALPAFQAANESFGYVDVKGLFERVYPITRQILVFSAALMPGLSQAMDPSRLPQTQTISQHLGPVVFAQTRRSDGYLLESSGPVTMLQALALVSATARGFVGNPESGH